MSTVEWTCPLRIRLRQPLLLLLFRSSACLALHLRWIKAMDHTDMRLAIDAAMVPFFGMASLYFVTKSSRSRMATAETGLMIASFAGLLLSSTLSIAGLASSDHHHRHHHHHQRHQRHCSERIPIEEVYDDSDDSDVEWVRPAAEWGEPNYEPRELVSEWDDD